MTNGFSFCIITDGREPAKLDQLVDSIRYQPFDARRIPYEILVGGIPHKDIQPSVIRVLMPDHANHGRLGAMRNALCRLAKYDHLVVCDDDMCFDFHWLDALLAYGDDYQVLCSRIENPDGTRYWDWATSGGPNGHHLLPYNRDDPHVYVTGGLCLMKRSVFDLTGGWNESLGFYQGEDLEFSGRLHALGVRIAFNHYTDCSGCNVLHDAPYTQSGRSIFRIG